MTPTNPELRQFIMQYFSDEELEILCFDYFPEVSADFAGGMTNSRKAIALIGHCDRRGRLDDLRAALARERSNAWNRQFAVAEAKKPSFSEETRFLNERDPRQIFLSHATADAEFAHQLKDDLEAEGWPVWIAPDSIRAGEKWVEAIDRGLGTSGVFVVVMTPDAVDSRWVRTETNAAISMEHRDLIRLFPLDVAECEPPWLWTQYQYLPFRNSYEAGLDALLSRLDGRRTAPPPTPIVVKETLPKIPPPTERKISGKQAEQIKALAHEIAAELGRQSGDDELREVYRRFNRHFGLGGYKQLPRRRFAEGMVFLTEWRDEIGRSTRNPLPEGEGVRAPALPDRHIHEKTGIELIRITAGPFLYGSADSDTMASDDEKPQRTIDLPEYWIGRYPVTNAQYKSFIDANPKQRIPFYDADWAKPYNWDEMRRSYPADKVDHPVVLVSWDDAKAFCDWAGLALPTEEQWEKAARGADRRIWPWGDEKPTDKHLNFNAAVGGTTPVGHYSPLGDSPYDCADMAGNVWEWTGSWYTEGSTRALRGGSWYDFDQLTPAHARRVPEPRRPAQQELRRRVPGGRTSLRSCFLIVAWVWSFAPDLTGLRRPVRSKRSIAIRLTNIRLYSIMFPHDFFADVAPRGDQLIQHDASRGEDRAKFIQQSHWVQLIHSRLHATGTYQPTCSANQSRIVRNVSGSSTRSAAL